MLTGLGDWLPQLTGVLGWVFVQGYQQPKLAAERSIATAWGYQEPLTKQASLPACFGECGGGMSK